MDADIDFRITPNPITGADEYISFRARDPGLVWSVTGFIQHSFRGQPTNQTSFGGAVSAGIAPRHYVGGLDRQWHVVFTSKRSYPRDLNLFGGKDQQAVSGQITPFNLDDDGTYYRYNGQRIVFLCAVVPRGGNAFTLSPVSPGEAFSGLPVRTDGSFEVRFAEYCA